MDPFTALGLATNVITIVDFSAKLIRKGKDAIEAAHGESQRLKDTEYLTLGLHDALQRLDYQRSQPGRYCALSPMTTGAHGEYQLQAISEKCRKIAKQLLDQMAGLEGDPNSRMDRVRAIWRYFRFSKDMTENARRLDEYKGQLETHIILSIRREVLDSVAYSKEYLQRFEANEIRIIEGIRRGEDTFARLEASIHSLRNMVMDDGERTRQLFRDLFATQGTNRTNSPWDELHESLKYPGWNHRQAEVVTAHDGTLDWTFSEPEEDTWPNLLAWLKREDAHAVFWITGKPGSGKSTLMKFITEVKLPAFNAQQGQHGGIPISHFFSLQGPALQKSIRGMLLSLLFQLLTAFPQHKTLIFEDLQMPPISTKRTEQENLDQWSYGLLLKGLRRCLTALSDADHVLLVLDGLDECSDDHDELCKVVKDLELWSSRKLRILAASRTWPVFQNLFALSGSAVVLYLDRYTASDIARYVFESLQDVERFRKLAEANPLRSEELVSLITDRANGVWVWVKLAVVRVKRLVLRGKFNMDFLIGEITSLPQELELLYDQILERLEPLSKSDCAALLLLSHITFLTKNLPHVWGSFWLKYALFTDPYVDEYNLIGDYYQQRQLLVADVDLELATGGLLYPDRVAKHRCPEIIHLTAHEWLANPKTQAKLISLIPEQGKTLGTVVIRASLAFLFVDGTLLLDWTSLATSLKLFFILGKPMQSELLLISESIMALCSLFCAGHWYPGVEIDSSVDQSQTWYEMTRLIWNFSRKTPDKIPVYSAFDKEDNSSISQPGQGVVSCSLQSMFIFSSNMSKPPGFTFAPSTLPCSLTDICSATDYSAALVVQVLSQGMDLDYHDMALSDFVELLHAGANPNLALNTNGCTAWACLLLFIDIYGPVKYQMYAADIIHTLTEFIRSDAEPVKSLSLPFRRSTPTSRIPLASEYLRPWLLRLLSEKDLYDGPIPSESEWAERIRHENWAEHPADSIARKQPWHLNALTKRPLHKWNASEPMPMTPRAKPSALEQEAIDEQVAWLIEERNKKCRAIVERILKEQGLRK